MKFLFVLTLISLISFTGYTQTLTDYIREAQKNHSTALMLNSTVDNNYSTNLQFGFFSNPQYTISGAQRAYVQLQQEIPWLGKSHTYNKIQKAELTQKELQLQYEKEALSYQVKESYYRMYQYQKQKDVYVIWADRLREFLKDTSQFKEKTIETLLKKTAHETQLIETTKNLQIVDGNYQNEVIHFNELLNSENLDEPNLPAWLAMPEEEAEFEFPNPLESASFKSFENSLITKQLRNKATNPWSPKISLGLRYINVIETDKIDFGLPNKDIIESQLQLKWNLFSRKSQKLPNDNIDYFLDQKLNTLSHQLQKTINDQISARIAYDATVQKLDHLKTLENDLKSINIETSTEKLLQINSLKYTFEIEQIKTVADYYIATSKMLLFF